MENNETDVRSAGETIAYVQYHANASAVTASYSQNCILKCGYRDCSGTLTAGAYQTYTIWEVPLSTCLSMTANANTLYPGAAVAWGGRELVTIVGRDETNNCYRILIYNSSSSTVNLSNLRVNYIAILRP